MNPLATLAGSAIVDALGKVGMFMMRHPELLTDLMDLIERGADPEEIKKALRDIKVVASDQAMKDELGLP